MVFRCRELEHPNPPASARQFPLQVPDLFRETEVEARRGSDDECLDVASGQRHIARGHAVGMLDAPGVQRQEELCLKAGNALLGLHGVPARLGSLLGADKENVLILGRNHDLPVLIAQADRRYADQCCRHRSTSCCRSLHPRA